MADSQPAYSWTKHKVGTARFCLFLADEDLSGIAVTIDAQIEFKARAAAKPEIQSVLFSFRGEIKCDVSINHPATIGPPSATLKGNSRQLGNRARRNRMDSALEAMGLAGRGSSEMPQIVAVPPEPIGEMVAGVQSGWSSVGDADVQLSRGRMRQLDGIHTPGNEQKNSGDGSGDDTPTQNIDGFILHGANSCNYS
jgi:hypothetical protein